MGWYVHIHVAFSCDRNEGVGELAAKHLAMLSESDDDAIRYVRFFLTELSERTGENPGPKGGLSLWGMTGNCTRADEFCQTLIPFWGELLSGHIDGGPCSHEHVIVFEEQEQSERAVAYEIASDDGAPITIKRHELPFAWMQF